MLSVLSSNGKTQACPPKKTVHLTQYHARYATKSPIIMVDIANDRRGSKRQTVSMLQIGRKHMRSMPDTTSVARDVTLSNIPFSMRFLK